MHYHQGCESRLQLPGSALPRDSDLDGEVLLLDLGLQDEGLQHQVRGDGGLGQRGLNQAQQRQLPLVSGAHGASIDSKTFLEILIIGIIAGQ